MQEHNNDIIDKSKIEDNEHGEKSLVDFLTNINNTSRSRNMKLQPKLNSSMKFTPENFFSKGLLGKKYTFENFLGEGGFGKVFLIRENKTGILRACKKILKNLINPEKKQSLTNTKKRVFIEEVEILKKQDHPNIVRIIDFYDYENAYYIITEYCSGGELFESIKQFKEFSEAKTAKILQQLISAVIYLHQNGIVHRDIKPENIIFQNDDPDSPIKLIDFGVSTKFYIGSPTKMKEFIGSVYYVAPEVLHRNYDEKCDTWSIGVQMYIQLFGHPPFNGITDSQICENILNTNIIFHNEKIDKISNIGKKLLSKMLRKNPEQRISQTEAYKDPWIQNNIISTPLSRKVLDNLEKFSDLGKLRNTLMNYIVTHICHKSSIKDLFDAFKTLDKDGKGSVTKEDLKWGYKFINDLDDAQAENQVNMIFEKLDCVMHQGSSRMNFNEFSIMAMNHEDTQNESIQKLAFNSVQGYGNGGITKVELTEFFAEIEVNNGEISSFMDKYDKNQDDNVSFFIIDKNKISFHDFRDLLKMN